MPTKVKAFETTDGMLHTNHALAVRHQNMLDRRGRISKWIERYCFSAMTVSDFEDYLVEHGEELGV